MSRSCIKILEIVNLICETRVPSSLADKGANRPSINLLRNDSLTSLSLVVNLILNILMNTLKGELKMIFI